MSERDDSRRQQRTETRESAGLSEAELRRYEELLRARHDEHAWDAEQLDRDAASAPERPRPEPSEQAKLVHDRMRTEGQLERQDRLREEVRRALVKIDEGTYGSCEDCGRKIDHDRLAVMPETRFCVECERAGERASGDVMPP